jgi:hypothetical protein
MKLQVLRNHSGQLVGVAFVRGEASVVVAQPAHNRRYHRICEVCCTREAVIFCRAHALYVCNHCIDVHATISDGACNVISMAVAAEFLDWTNQDFETGSLQ